MHKRFMCYLTSVALALLPMGVRASEVPGYEGIITKNISTACTTSGAIDLREKAMVIQELDKTQYTISLKIVGQSENGFDGEIVITNTGIEDIEDWVMGFEFDGDISGFSTAQILDHEDQNYVITNVGGNSKLAIGETLTLGFSAKGQPRDLANYHLGYISNTVEETPVDVNLDTDEDGLTDIFEQALGSNKEAVDSDNDGLPDAYEYYFTGTSPSDADTDKNGIEDGEEDLDGDGLSNLEEYALETLPRNADSDVDGLPDKDEVEVYDTNPLEADSDGDGLIDGEEIKLNLNPNVSDTDGNGIQDADEKIEQIFKMDMEQGRGPSKVSVRGKIAGVITKGVQVNNLYEKEVVTSNLEGLVGAPIEIVSEGKLEEGSLSISYDQASVGVNEEALLLLKYDQIAGTYTKCKQFEVDKINHCIKGQLEGDGVYLISSNEPVKKAIRRAKYSLRAADVDTDYDGIIDSLDELPTNSIQTVYFKEGGKSDVVNYKQEYSMNYTWFFKDNTVYNADLSKTSALFAGLAYHPRKGESGSYFAFADADGNNEQRMDEVMKKHGFSNVTEYSLKDDYNDNDVSAVSIGHHKVSYNGQTKEIILMSVRGTSGTKEWYSNFDVGDERDFSKFADWTNKKHHKGFDVATTRILRKLDEYISKNNIDTKDLTFWITGHSRGAGIANLLGKRLEDRDYTTYTYTFAAPSVTTDKANVSKYKSIFNILNKGDLVPYLPCVEWGFTRYGKNCVAQMDDNLKAIWKENVGKSYNTEGESGLDTTVEALGAVSNSRAACYSYSCSCHGDGTNDDIKITNYSVSGENRDADLAKIPTACRPYCKISYFTDKVVFVKRYNFYCCQSCAYFMNYLAAFMGGDLNVQDFVLHDVGKKYEYAKQRIMLTGNGVTGGVEHPHYIETYVLLADETKF